ncbi:MAG TPA: peptide-N-glycosidase F-related protein [candidate division Zixibacteria bacterium]|nr:peptide-N-glycosidase [candidate division Zixibacteria bacterium]MDD4916529.1 peptide-N-glycosidase F-related protein [candidate division Zixibacteria bacterium]MDM7974227.1 peptide-N-glycosidase F-related protein [candidate division Zixibacteria bacterium]HOD66105.1 peptide-N-glycosidase F-related protein [candidate division Zixibacteria bacterium]HQL22991.1 peptide-N-glycosidase F-related protein [candidate division Zixibacteria bacterium]
MRAFVLPFLVWACTAGILPPALARGAPPVTHVISHDRTLAVTDPSTGSNPLCAWAVFPPESVAFRTAVLSVTYACPDGLHCGEWDYIDYIFLRRVGGQAAPAQDLEVARMISPYGWRFDSTWSFTWHVDITDFAWMLHDSVEVEFLHTGYESNTDRGWVITLDFALTEGRPAMTCLGMETLWQGSIPYGDSARPIARTLAPVSVIAPTGAARARLRILQTGHGMDDQENCAEFCRKTRRIIVNEVLVDERPVWRTCGDNPLFPQAGTWLFDRANWCPGSIVQPDLYDLPVTPGSTHTVALEMEPYVNPGNPSAAYVLSSYLFYYAPPWAAHDATLEEILIPSSADEYSRLNPSCRGARLLIRNSGREALTAVAISYGPPEAPQTFEWTGELASQARTEVALPGSIAGDRPFAARLELPNGRPDEYPADNELTSTGPAVPVYAPDLVLALRSNNDSAHNSYRLTDGSGAIVRERALGTLGAGALYRDTLHLAPGCYELTVDDTAGDGLDFWFNPEGGYGYVRLLDGEGRLVKSFVPDFGRGIRHSFMVAQDAPPAAAAEPLPIVNPFPIRNRGVFAIDFFDNDPHPVAVTVLSEDSSRTVYERSYPEVREMMIPVDISAEPDGYYWVRVTAGDRTATRRIKVTHQD